MVEYKVQVFEDRTEWLNLQGQLGEFLEKK